MSKTFVRWTVRTLVAGFLLAGTVALGTGTSSADQIGIPPSGSNGTSWSGGNVH